MNYKFNVCMDNINQIVRMLIMSNENVKRIDNQEVFLWDDKHFVFYNINNTNINDVQTKEIVNKLKDIINKFDIEELVFIKDGILLYRININNPEKYTVYNLDRMKQSLPHVYERLINKMIKQYHSKCMVEWNEIKSAALEGFALAIDKYDDTKSKMSFMQFAAFYIKNTICLSLDNNSRIVKLNNYARTQYKGEVSTFNTISIDNYRDDGTMVGYSEFHKVITEKNNTKDLTDGDVYEYIYMRLEEQFTEKDCDIFYRLYGLKGYDVYKGIEISKELGVSAAYITQRTKRMIKWIRSNEEFCEMLQNLF